MSTPLPGRGPSKSIPGEDEDLHPLRCPPEEERDWLAPFDEDDEGEGE